MRGEGLVVEGIEDNVVENDVDESIQRKRLPSGNRNADAIQHLEFCGTVLLSSKPTRGRNGIDRTSSGQVWRAEVPGGLVKPWKQPYVPTSTTSHWQLDRQRPSALAHGAEEPSHSELVPRSARHSGDEIFVGLA